MLINKRSVPSAIIHKVGNTQVFTTIQGTYESSEYFMAKNIYFHNFCKMFTIPNTYVLLFNSPKSWYNIIIGHDVLAHGFILDHARHIITWGRLPVPIQESSSSSVTTNSICTDTALTVYAAASTPTLKERYGTVQRIATTRCCTNMHAHFYQSLIERT